MIDTTDNKTKVEAETADMIAASSEHHDVKMREISEKVALRNYYFGTILPPLSIFIFSSLLVIFIWFPPDFIAKNMEMPWRTLATLSPAIALFFTLLAANKHANTFHVHGDDKEYSILKLAEKFISVLQDLIHKK